MRTLVLVPVFTRTSQSAAGAARRTPSLHSPQDRLSEARGLAEAIDLDIADARLVPVPQPRPSTLFGSGKVEEIAACLLYTSRCV